MKLYLFVLVIVLHLTACKSTPSLTAAEYCQPLTYQCHKELKPQTLSEKTGKQISRAYKYYSANNLSAATSVLNNIKATKEYDKAYINKMLAGVDKQREIKYLELALQSPILSANEYKNALLSLATAYFDVEQYDEVKQLTKRYYDYMQTNYQSSLAVRLAYIAKIENDLIEYNILVETINKNSKNNATLTWLKNALESKKITDKPQNITKSDSAAPYVLFRQEPHYPSAAIRDCIEGSVIMGYDINHQGRPINIKINESSPKNVFDEEAIKAFKKWKFKVELLPNNEVNKGKNRTLRLDWAISKNHSCKQDASKNLIDSKLLMNELGVN